MHEFGAQCEHVAVVYLKKHHYSILDRNIRYPQGEVDILAYEPDPVWKGVFYFAKSRSLARRIVSADRGTLVIVEVKARQGDGIAPEDRVDAWRFKKLTSAGYFFCTQYRFSAPRFRIDVISVLATSHGTYRIRHIKGFCRERA
ncbi:MAG: hypothetical protein A3H59_03330 [Candidatus Jacksonbacteria bacterium RIFCSPLOWO2_02_FULL_43_9]|nr:MAG: hypothetical protein UV70_C0010G0023 [Parcubacteria group bacterium GW2011_GWA2_43_13]OGY68470.1 MAG: hypothetical protein A3B94_02845 [Candidatus Jacksonbacteria bacterium RIFCSPHIGHO2_02_FULL_43_10]OGY70733.1 MAG: hypothetical protein A2986_03105 [Candidatus Jacksonbacteria bacterium RIFCSPLOWO2_01_FULL_44_13]OGY72219.1 MAG: hypothetical protein A3H59_03330 [Candidatus Jacksonbacteria bacterium RIFCSPLOWO2_02_FULL_43_9]HAZ16672.1 hypothetical protein [Candidatus Jacksonbacteria bacter